MSKIIFPILAKLLLLMCSSFIGGHGVVNFLALLFSFNSSFSGASSMCSIISITVYFVGILVFFFGLISIRMMGKKLVKMGLICDVIAFGGFCIYAFQFHVNYGVFFLTSLPFIGLAIISFYVLRSKKDRKVR